MERRMFDDLSPQQLTAIEHQTQEIGRYLFDHLQVDTPSVLERRWWDHGGGRSLP